MSEKKKPEPPDQIEHNLLTMVRAHQKGKEAFDKAFDKLFPEEKAPTTNDAEASGELPPTPSDAA